MLFRYMALAPETKILLVLVLDYVSTTISSPSKVWCFTSDQQYYPVSLWS